MTPNLDDFSDGMVSVAIADGEGGNAEIKVNLVEMAAAIDAFCGSVRETFFEPQAKS